MLFNSLIFLFVFLPLILFIYYIIDIKMNEEGERSSEKKQIMLNMILVLFSLAFFAWDNIGNLTVLLFLILFNYIIGMSQKECRKVLLLGVICNLAVLIRFKYLSFILSALHTGETAAVIAPLGISFIIFHCISYQMDLYQKRVEPEHNIIHFALYITFFPKLIQGPIIKYRDMREQIVRRKQVTMDNLAAGSERFIIGLAKKVLIADLLGETVTEIFGLVSYWGMDVPTAWIGCLAYTVQIYMDFSGYSDMAIGLGIMFGFHIEENFNFPYLSKSITEFWRRWHISLGGFFRDYLYIPLGGNRRGNVYLNLFFVFLATGIWHGAGVLFILWGVGHGVCVVLERWVQKMSWYQKIPSFFKWAVTMLLVSIGWLTFILPDVGQMGRYLGFMVGIENASIPGYLPFTWEHFLTPRFITLICISAFGIAILSREGVQRWYHAVSRKFAGVQAVKYGFLLVLWCLSFIAIVATEYSPFIYFQF